MRFTRSLVILATSVLPTVITAQTDTRIEFTLRAWRDGRHPGSILPLSIYVELDPTTGDAIINQTAGYTGFASVRNFRHFGEITLIISVVLS